MSDDKTKSQPDKSPPPKPSTDSRDQKALSETVHERGVVSLPTTPADPQSLEAVISEVTDLAGPDEGPPAPDPPEGDTTN